MDTMDTMDGMDTMDAGMPWPIASFRESLPAEATRLDRPRDARSRGVANRSPKGT
jgi:hypothetical protein